MVDALWDLAWAGEVTNDTLGGAARARSPRARPRAERRRRVSGFRSRRQAPPSAVGRWSLVALPRARADADRARKALAEQLLARHGVLTRDAVAFEGVPGRLRRASTPCCRRSRRPGRIRRGYFVAGLGGLQFAEPGALEALRAAREPEPEAPQAVVLAAADPANPYGAALPWPKRAEGDDARPRPASRARRGRTSSSWTARSPRP